jgi:predicted RNase H-like nuclease
VIVIDIPIGLLDDTEAAATPKGLSGGRPVDKGARKWCPSPSSVFPAPTREQLASAVREHERAARAADPADRRARLSNVRPGGMSAQSLQLVPAIESARKLKALLPDQVFEAHPEVTFTVLAGGVLPIAKSTLLGGLARAGVLSRHVQFDVLQWALELEARTRVAADNWLDALSMALVARDWALGRRAILSGSDGNVETWNGQRDRIMALPATDLTGPPPRLPMDAARQLAVGWKQPVEATA